MDKWAEFLDLWFRNPNLLSYEVLGGRYVMLAHEPLRGYLITDDRIWAEEKKSDQLESMVTKWLSGGPVAGSMQQISYETVQKAYEWCEAQSRGGWSPNDYRLIKAAFLSVL